MLSNITTIAIDGRPDVRTIGINSENIKKVVPFTIPEMGVATKIDYVIDGRTTTYWVSNTVDEIEELFIPKIDYIFPDQTNLIAAYGLKKLNPNYTGNCLKIKRTSDSAIMDFGFVEKTNEFNLSAAILWLNGSKGIITTIYDQIGVNHRTQLSDSLMGYIDTDYNGRPVVRMNNRLEGACRYESNLPSINTRNISVFTVASTMLSEFFDGSTGNEMYAYQGSYPPSTVLYDGLHFRSATLKTDKNECSLAVSGFSSNSTRARIKLDELDESLLAFSITTYNNNYLRMGENAAGAQDMIGVWAESLIYDIGVDNSTFDSIVANQNTRWSIPDIRTKYLKFLGDSIFYGYRIATPTGSNVFDSPAGQLSKMAGDMYKVINAANNSWTFNNYIDDVNFENKYIQVLNQTSMIPIVIIMLGTNDIGLDNSLATVQSELDTMVSKIKAVNSNINIVVVTVLDRGIFDVAPRRSIKESFNQYIRDNYNDSANGLYVVDLDNNAFIGYTGAYADTNYFEADDTHPNTAGDYQIALEIYNVITNI